MPKETIIGSTIQSTRNRGLSSAISIMGLGLMLISNTAFSEDLICVKLMAKDQPDLTIEHTAIPKMDLDAQLAVGYSAPNIETYRILKNVESANPALQNDEALKTVFRQLLMDESIPTYHRLLGKLLVKVQEQDPKDRAAVLNILKVTLTDELSNFMSTTMATSRAAIIESKDLDKAKLMKALGEMSSQESLEALIGTHGINNIDADSLVGRYLTEAKSQGIDVTSLENTFSKGPGHEGRGGSKLFLSVDTRTSALAKKYFGQNPHLMMHAHDPGQGTLMVYFNNTRRGYSGEHEWPLRWETEIGVNNIFPIIPLSSREVDNFVNYLDLGKMLKARAKYPWVLKGISTEKDGSEKVSEYCIEGGYGSCTHWWGEAPIGDTLVSDLTFPGHIGDDPYGHELSEADQNQFKDHRALRAQPIGNYTHYRTRSTSQLIGYDSRLDRLTRMVWLENGQSHEQLWSMVTTEADNSGPLSRGEWANPGWVLYTLLSASTQNRVPVVLVFRQDASQPLTTADIDALKNSITTR